MERFPAHIVEVKELTHNTNSYLLRLDSGHFNYKAGQFVMLEIEHAGEKMKRPYSIASPPQRDDKHAEYLELVIKHVPQGRFTDKLWKKKAGDEVVVYGPFGQFTLKEPIQEGDIFMATGSGIAPFMAMLRKVFRDHNQKQFYLFFGCRNSDEIIYADELFKWDFEHKNFKLIVVLSQPKNGWGGEVGYVQDKLTKYVKGFENKQAYLCGIPMMIEQSKAKLIKLGMKPENIYMEKY